MHREKSTRIADSEITRIFTVRSKENMASVPGNLPRRFNKKPSGEYQTVFCTHEQTGNFLEIRTIV